MTQTLPKNYPYVAQKLPKSCPKLVRRLRPLESHSEPAFAPPELVPILREAAVEGCPMDFGRPPLFPLYLERGGDTQ